MKSANQLMWALVATLALFLAGCGGGGSNTGTGEMPDPEPTPVEQAETAYTAAEAAEMAAMEARKEAAKLLAEAKKKNGMLDVWTAGGDSTVVEANAQAVLDAKALIEAQKMKAEAEKMKAEEAKKALDALPAGTPSLAAQKKVAAMAIEKAKVELDAIKKLLRGPGSIGKLIEEITGSDGTGTPAKKGEPIAKIIETALAPFSNDNGRPAIVDLRTHRPATQEEVDLAPDKVIPNDPSDDLPATDTGKSKAVLMDNAPDFAKTFKEIVGEGMLVKKAFGTDNMDVDVLPLDGMPLSALTGSDGTPVTTLPAFTAGKADDQYYKGMVGTLHCTGTCELDGTNMKGDLYFRADPRKRFHMKASDIHYSEYHAFVTYGYWLYETGENIGIRFYSASTSQRRGEVGAHATLPDKATYKGKALGLSVLKLFSTSTGEQTGIKSGQFTADVTLNATFGDNAATQTLGGTVDNFVGKAVDPNWSVELKTKAGSGDRWEGLNSSGSVRDAPISQGSGTGGPGVRTGEWNANSYGEGDWGYRPMGFMGYFNAHFKNGAAAGAYATRRVTETTE